MDAEARIAAAAKALRAPLMVMGASASESDRMLLAESALAAADVVQASEAADTIAFLGECQQADTAALTKAYSEAEQLRTALNSAMAMLHIAARFAYRLGQPQTGQAFRNAAAKARAVLAGSESPTPPYATEVPYEPCVLGADGRCTRWSHDHSAESPTNPDATNEYATPAEEATICAQSGCQRARAAARAVVDAEQKDATK